MSATVEQGGGASDNPISKYINVEVRSAYIQVHYKIRTNVLMEKLKIIYSNRVGIPMTALRFLFDGRRIGNDETPEQLEMEDGDIIEAYEQQLGGSTTME